MDPFVFKASSDVEYRWRHIPGAIGAEAMEFSERMAAERDEAEAEQRTARYGADLFKNMRLICLHCVIDKNGKRRFDDETVDQVNMVDLIEVGMHVMERTFEGSMFGEGEEDKPGES